MVLRFCCEMCGWEKKKSFLCRKMITYHFSVLVLSLSRWICSQQCHRVSLEMVFYSVWRSQWGHAAGTTPWPVPLTVSIPITVSSRFSPPLPIYLMPLIAPLWSRRWRTCCARLPSFSASLTVKILHCQRQTDYEKLVGGSCTLKLEKKKERIHAQKLNQEDFKVTT